MSKRGSLSLVEEVRDRSWSVEIDASDEPDEEEGIIMSGELDEGPDDDVVDSQGEHGSEADGEHSGGLPRHTGPPPEEISGFEVDPELEDLLNRDVMELDEEIRQDVQLYRSRKMQAVRDSDLGKADGEITSTEEEDEEEAAPASGTTGDEVEDGEKGGSSLLPDWAWPG